MSDPLPQLLKRYFGYDSFRPLQREIMEENLARRDVVAILPTGAGKSLCFQLPALAREGLTLVVSPLIALMKDQVDSLTASGVSATLLNSSVKGEEARLRRAGLDRGEYKLLYAAPERIMSESFLADIQRWKVTTIAIDEAHCISEWGHDFRPEYRRLAELRERLPGVPFLALTATATEQVRNDIIRQLHLRDPEVFLASFNRPNLSYTILPKGDAATQVSEFIRERPGEAGIVYVLSRKSAESLAARLVEEGIKAVPYHAGLQPEERAANQEAFIRDEVRVVCATIAFGMGINKPDVRFVIHADLPKNIEGYYQETGRAGRDGLPADCLLLFSRGDLVRNLRFLEEMSDAQAAEVAARQMRQMADFAEAPDCRRRALLAYFGEEWPGENCGSCDSCLEPRETWDATTEAQKFLSCILRIQQMGPRAAHDLRDRQGNCARHLGRTRSPASRPRSPRRLPGSLSNTHPLRCGTGCLEKPHPHPAHPDASGKTPQCGEGRAQREPPVRRGPLCRTPYASQAAGRRAGSPSLCGLRRHHPETYGPQLSS
jgi:ATP-dependent DNA helicase RecQ